MDSFLVIPNKTKYYHDKTKTSNVVSSPSNFTSYASRRKDVFHRLYFEYKHCLENGGYALFYTLTYAEHAITKFFGHNVHNYDDLGWLFKTSSFTKDLKRYFNTSIKYCITSEFGEGKGVRGYHNNPHYHAIFYLYPIDANKPIINAVDFRTLIQSYWQGCFSRETLTYKERIDPSNLLDVNTQFDLFKFGRCTEGDFYGVINSPKALSYVVKYVTKDDLTCYTEKSILNSIDAFYKVDYKYDDAYMNDVIDYFIHKVLHKEYDNTNYAVLQFMSRKVIPYLPDFIDFIQKYNDDMRSCDIRKYNLHYKVRFRASQGLGYSLFSSSDFNIDEASVVSYIDDNNPKVERISGQLFRAWFYRNEVHKVYSPTQMKVINQTYYRPNGNYTLYKKTHFEDMLKKSEKMVNDLFEQFNTSFPIDFAKTVLNFEASKINELKNNNHVASAYFIFRLSNLFDRVELVHRIALYNSVYRGRTFDNSVIPPICPKNDYSEFIQKDFEVTFKDNTFNPLILTNTSLYENHPYFEQVSESAELLLQFSDYLATINSRHYWQTQRAINDARRKANKTKYG